MRLPPTKIFLTGMMQIKLRLKHDGGNFIDTDALSIQLTIHVIAINYRQFSGISVICYIRDKFPTPYFKQRAFQRYLNRTCIYLC